MNLKEQLENYERQGKYPFHMPGHKRNTEFMEDMIGYKYDITEIGGFDDLHNPEGIIKDMGILAAQIFKAEETHCLINGSTVGNLASILATTNPGDKVIIARNSHKSIYNAMEMNQLVPIYVYPEFIEEYGINGEILLSDIEKEIHNHGEKIKAVIITSPTYEGVISDVKSIANLVHEYKIPLIVDEAHGAHLGLDHYFHSNSNQLGADIVIQSIHKTLPAPTQTALLHINGDLIERNNVVKYLSILQSSSPSYILMTGISNCLAILDNPKFETTMLTYILNLKKMRNQLLKMKCLQLVDSRFYDASKIVISTNRCNISSKSLISILKYMYDIELEMDGITYIIAMTSVADTAEGLTRLTEALVEIDNNLIYKEPLQNHEENKQLNEDLDSEQKKFHEIMEFMSNISCDNIVKYLYTYNKEQHTIVLESESVEEVSVNINEELSSSYIYLYPPGIPIVTPGERITNKLRRILSQLENEGYKLIKK